MATRAEKKPHATEVGIQISHEVWKQICSMEQHSIPLTHGDHSTACQCIYQYEQANETQQDEGDVSQEHPVVNLGILQNTEKDSVIVAYTAAV